MENEFRQGRRFVVLMLLGTLAGSAVMPSINVVIDRFRVLGGDIAYAWQYRQGFRENPPFEPNERYMRMKYVESNPGRYDSFVFGSSRVRYLDAEKLGENWYKLNYSAGMPRDHLRHLRVLLDQGVGISGVAIGLDRFAFYMPYPPGSIQFKAVPRSLTETLGFYYEYLWRRLNLQDRDIMMGRAELARTGIAVGYGPVPWSEADTQRLRNDPDHEKKLLSLPVFSRTLTETTPGIGDTLAAISEIIELCEREGIDLTLYMNPFHYKNYLAMDHDELDRIFEGLAALAPFYDFSGLNEYTTDNAYWFETSHFTPPVNDLVIAAIRGETGPADPYPVWVTTKNVEEHRMRQRREISRSLPALLRRDHRIEVHLSILGAGNVLSGGKVLGAAVTPVQGVRSVDAGESLGLATEGQAPVIRLDPGETGWAGPQVLRLGIGATHPGSFVLHGSDGAATYRGNLRAGENEFYIPVTDPPSSGGYRVEFGAGSNYFRLYLLALYPIRDGINPEGEGSVRRLDVYRLQ